MPNRGGFSWKRAVGISAAKSRISRSTGIPLTKSGRQRKVGRMVTGGGCLIPSLVVVLAGAAVMLSACTDATTTPNDFLGGPGSSTPFETQPEDGAEPTSPADAIASEKPVPTPAPLSVKK